MLEQRQADADQSASTLDLPTQHPACAKPPVTTQAGVLPLAPLSSIL